MLREAIFNICQNEIEGARFLDLFAGSGAMGLEALSRGASHATFIEQNRIAIQCIKENIAALQVEKACRIVPMHYLKALSLLQQEKMQFELIYVDPPYDMFIDLTSIASLLAPVGILFLEERNHPKQTKATELPHLRIKNVRRFGIARLSVYTF